MWKPSDFIVGDTAYNHNRKMLKGTVVRVNENSVRVSLPDGTAANWKPVLHFYVSKLPYEEYRAEGRMQHAFDISKLCEPRVSTTDMPIHAATICVILLRPNQPPMYATSLVQKREMYYALCSDASASAIAVWPGQYSSDAFEVTKEQLADC